MSLCRNTFGFFVWEIIYTFLGTCNVFALHDILQFGIRTCGTLQGQSTNWCNSGANSIVTLWYNYSIYQFSMKPIYLDTWYYAYKQSTQPIFNIIGEMCHDGTYSNLPEAKLMIELDANDAIGVDQVQFTTTSGDVYGINSFNIQNTVENTLCITNDYCMYGTGVDVSTMYKQIVYFDLTKPNQYIMNASWINAVSVEPETEVCDYAPTLLTPTYGVNGGIKYAALYQGRVYAMLNWGVQGSTYLHIRNWHSDDQNTVQDYGEGAHHAPCTPFNLSSDDYITGYQVWVLSDTKLTGLRFNTRNGIILSCIGVNDDTTTTYSNHYDYGPYNFSYLTGWNIWSGDYIDKIQFQFTASLLTASTLLPTDSSVIPTTNFPSVNHITEEDISQQSSTEIQHLSSNHAVDVMLYLVPISAVTFCCGFWLCLLMVVFRNKPSKQFAIKSALNAIDSESDKNDAHMNMRRSDILDSLEDVQHNKQESLPWTVEGDIDAKFVEENNTVAKQEITAVILVPKIEYNMDEQTTK